MIFVTITRNETQHNQTVYAVIRWDSIRDLVVRQVRRDPTGELYLDDEVEHVRMEQGRYSCHTIKPTPELDELGQSLHR